MNDNEKFYIQKEPLLHHRVIGNILIGLSCACLYQQFIASSISQNLFFIPVVNSIALFLVLYNYRYLGTQNLSSIHKIYTLFLILFFLPSGIPSLVLNTAKFFFQEYQNSPAILLPVAYRTPLICILMSFSINSRVRSKRVIQLWIIFLMNSLSAHLYLKLYLQGHIGQTIGSLYTQVFSRSFAMQLWTYPVLAIPVILSLLPLFIWIGTGITLLSRSPVYKAIIRSTSKDEIAQ